METGSVASCPRGDVRRGGEKLWLTQRARCSLRPGMVSGKSRMRGLVTEANSRDSELRVTFAYQEGEWPSGRRLEGHSLGTESLCKVLKNLIPLGGEDALTPRRKGFPCDAAKAETMEIRETCTFFVPEIVDLVGIEIHQVRIISGAIGRDFFGIYLEKFPVKRFWGIPGTSEGVYPVVGSPGVGEALVIAWSPRAPVAIVGVHPSVLLHGDDAKVFHRFIMPRFWGNMVVGLLGGWKCQYHWGKCAYGVAVGV